MLGPGTLEGQLWARCHREHPLCPSSAALNQPLPFRLSPHLQAQTHFHRRVGSGDTLGEGCEWIGTCRGHTRAVRATPLSDPHLPGRPCCRNVPRAVPATLSPPSCHGRFAPQGLLLPRPRLALGFACPPAASTVHPLFLFRDRGEARLVLSGTYPGYGSRC